MQHHTRFSAFSDTEWSALQLATTGSYAIGKGHHGNYCYWAHSHAEAERVKALCPHIKIDREEDKAESKDFASANIGDAILLCTMGQVFVVESEPTEGVLERLLTRKLPDGTEQITHIHLFGKQRGTRKHKRLYQIAIEEISYLSINGTEVRAEGTEVHA
jgi:hypothetical protein